jgi:2-polyprenyl-3-methyl-5-hydroxy-6-metoxy-1,4-benzoquinol methylase
MNLDEIQDYWRGQARTHGTDPRASWSDVRARELEVQALVARIADGDRVLDVGCANGWSTVRLAQARRAHVRGIDYLPEWIESAGRNLEGAGQLAGTAEFALGNVLELDEPAGAYDAVVSVRVLINLGSWENQRRALQACATCLRPGGRLLLSEATVQGLARLNALRAEFGLETLRAPGFNTYLDEERVAEALAPACALEEVCHFASSYFVGTRVIKPLLARIAPGEVDVANPDSEWNRLCAMLPPAGDYATQRLLVYRRRG